YGRDLTRSFTRALRAAGGTVVGEDPYLEEMEDFRPYLERLRRRGAGLVFVAGYDQGARTMIPQARALGLAAPFMGGDGLEALTGAGGGYDGTLVGVLFHPDAGERARAFAATYRAKWQREPDSSAALAYDAVHLLARALRAGARDRAAVRRYLEGVGRPGGSPPFEGAAGPVAFDAHGDPVNKAFVVGRLQGGRIVLPQTGRGAR
ncbi:MAG TPA: ABC transporter substrate-binding protein, partial [Longimicrobium sp.]|nr:ABC transporter substrate-binding protein [Longimicrobium sp.]